MWTITSLRLRRNRRGISNIIVVVLSLVIIVIIVSNIVLFSYEMNQLDWNRTREKIKIVHIDLDLLQLPKSIRFTFKNEGALTAHLVSLWINNSTSHQHVDIDLFMDAGETTTYTVTYNWKTGETYTFKAITERGNVATYSKKTLQRD